MVMKSDLTIAYEEECVVQSVKYERGADR